MSSKKNTRQLPAWMLDGKATDVHAQKKQKVTTKTKTAKTTTQQETNYLDSVDDPLKIYKVSTKPAQNPQQRLQEIFKTAASSSTVVIKSSPQKQTESPKPKKLTPSPVHSTQSTPSPVKYPSTPTKSTPSPVKYDSPKLEKTSISPVQYKVSPPQISKKPSPSTAKKRKYSSDEEESLSPLHSPKTSSHTLGNSPLRSPKLSPERSVSPAPFEQKPLLSETERKRILELDKKEDNDSNYSSGSVHSVGSEVGEEEGESGSDNDLNDEENDDFDFFANNNSIFSPLPSPELSSSGSEEKIEQQQEKKPRKSGGFICDYPCSKKLESNNNKELTDALENIQKLHYLYGEQWQELSMRKAITALRRHPVTITHISQVKDIPGIGSSITNKIAAFLEGKPIATKGPTQLDLFGNIWGAGPKAVKSWINKGYTTLEQLLHDPELTPEQRIGIKYYNAFRTRIPRQEVEQHVAKVAEIVKQMPSSVTASVIAAGSYRRGREDCGDIDVLVLHPSTKPIGVLQDLIGRLHKTQFLLDDLQLSQIKNRDWSHHFDKYMGVSTVGGLPRRIDIMVVPAGSHAATLLYMTGSAYFNRSLRLKSKKNGFYLCNHAVARADINGKRVGPPIPVHSEEEIFELLSTPYQPPHSRDW